MLFGICIYARKWRMLEDEQLKVQILSDKIQPQKKNERLHINMQAWNDLKKQNPDFWAWIYWQNGIVSQPVVIDTGGKEYLYQNFDGKPENAVFTRLAELSDKKLFYEYQSFYLCMQDKIEEYKVFLIAIKNKKLDWNYQQKDFSSAEKFYEWIADAKRVSVIYDTDIKPRYSDAFVTIQTCLDAYSSKRVILLAMKVKEYPIQED